MNQTELITVSLNLAKEMLGELFSTADVNTKINVKTLSILNNNSVLCEFYPISENSTDIKAEIATIMGFLASAFESNPIESLDLTNYAVRAYSANDIELMYAISSKEAARQISLGNSLEWLSGTLFRENTNDYRLARAKKLIAEIENSLRFTITDIFKRKYGTNWWSQVLNTREGKKVEEIYKQQFGFSNTDGSILINYTYLLHLGKIVVSSWPDFKLFFDNKNDFEKLISDLNEIRREEAHNRVISETYLGQLAMIHSKLHLRLVKSYPNLLPTYLLNNWKIQIRDIVGRKFTPIISEEEIRLLSDLSMKLEKILGNTQALINYINSQVVRIESIPIPTQALETHNDLLLCFKEMARIHQLMLNSVKTGKVEDFNMNQNDLEKQSARLKEISLKILLI